MTQLFDKIARAYRAGGVAEVGRRGYNKYLVPHIGQNLLYIRHQVRKERNRLNKLVTDFEQDGVGTRLTREDLLPYKTSDTLFVLASGGSINQITDEQWLTIDKHDSVGLNRWPIHEFVPTYHVFELPAADTEMRQSFLKLLRNRKEAYRNTPSIIKDILRMPEAIRECSIRTSISGDLLLSRDSNFTNVPANAKAQRQLLQILASSRHTTKKELDILYRKSGSVSYLIYLAALLGYHNIVLCGVDMVNSEYFFMQKRYEEKNIPIPEPNVKDTKRTHRTNDPNRGSSMTLEHVIYIMDEVILQPNNINLYVENDISALHPRIPLYSYE
jgi:hypothetical protein